MTFNICCSFYFSKKKGDVFVAALECPLSFIILLVEKKKKVRHQDAQVTSIEQEISGIVQVI